VSAPPRECATMTRLRMFGKRVSRFAGGAEEEKSGRAGDRARVRESTGCMRALPNECQRAKAHSCMSKARTTPSPTNRHKRQPERRADHG